MYLLWATVAAFCLLYGLNAGVHCLCDRAAENAHWTAKARGSLHACVHLPEWVLSGVLVLQLKGTVRATLSPLVETIPCLGAVTITLLETPYTELSFSLLNKFDIMSLPLLHTAANYGLKMVRPCTVR